jgi:hypothetical protein
LYHLLVRLASGQLDSQRFDDSLKIRVNVESDLNNYAHNRSQRNALSAPILDDEMELRESKASLSFLVNAMKRAESFQWDE